MLKRKKYLSFLVNLIIWFAISAQGQEAQNLLNGIDRRFFIENKGQWPKEVKYLCKTGGMNAWITDNGVVYDYYQIVRGNESKKTTNLQKMMETEQNDRKNTRIKGHVVRALLAGTNTRPDAVGKGEKEGYYNYFIGNDPVKWASFVRLYDEAEVREVYPGIDIRYYYDNGQLRYDYRVAAGADPSQIQFHLEGSDGYEVNDQGELLVKTSLGEVRHGKIRAYQQSNGTEKEVACRFLLKPNGKVGIKAMDYDKGKSLIIDPLIYSTFIGGEDGDTGNSITIDNSGNAYITGYTWSSNYPTTNGAYDQS
jgi:hypothetical protein